MCGKVGEALSVMSNRTAEGKEGEGQVKSVLGGEGGETVGVSNGAFGGVSWEKVELGKELLNGLVNRHVLRRAEGDGHGEIAFIEELFGLLSTDTLPKRPVDRAGWNDYLKEFRKSIFIPAVGQKVDGKGKGYGMSGIYGTQKHSVVLVDKKGHVTFVERTLYDNDAKTMDEAKRDQRYEFDIEGWMNPT